MRAYIKGGKCIKLKSAVHEHAVQSDRYEEFVVKNEIKRMVLEYKKKKDLREIYNEVMSR